MPSARVSTVSVASSLHSVSSFLVCLADVLFKSSKNVMASVQWFEAIFQVFGGPHEPGLAGNAQKLSYLCLRQGEQGFSVGSGKEFEFLQEKGCGYQGHWVVC